MCGHFSTRRGVGSGDWGMGNGNGEKAPLTSFPTPHSPFPTSQHPTPYSPLPTPHSLLPTPHSPFPSLRSIQDAFLEDQRAARVGPHLASRRASDLFRLAPTHLHLLLGHSRIDLPLLNRPPYVSTPFIFQPGILRQQMVFELAQVSDLFLDVGSTHIQIDEALLAVRRFEFEANRLLLVPSRNDVGDFERPEFFYGRHRHRATLFVVARNHQHFAP